MKRNNKLYIIAFLCIISLIAVTYLHIKEGFNSANRANNISGDIVTISGEKFNSRSIVDDLDLLNLKNKDSVKNNRYTLSNGVIGSGIDIDASGNIYHNPNNMIKSKYQIIKDPSSNNIRIYDPIIYRCIAYDNSGNVLGGFCNKKYHWQIIKDTKGYYQIKTNNNFMCLNVNINKLERCQPIPQQKFKITKFN
jgi:hypothetical protein